MKYELQANQVSALLAVADRTCFVQASGTLANLLELGLIDYDNFSQSTCSYRVTDEGYKHLKESGYGQSSKVIADDTRPLYEVVSKVRNKLTSLRINVDFFEERTLERLGRNEYLESDEAVALTEVANDINYILFWCQHLERKAENLGETRPKA